MWREGVRWGVMAQLSSEQVKKIAKLARLTLTEAEVEKFRPQLSEILKYVELLDEVNVEGVPPTAQTTGSKNVFREDKAGPAQSLSQKEALGNAQRTDGHYFVVPAVFGPPIP